jgi:hypothetical protein
MNRDHLIRQFGQTSHLSFSLQGLVSPLHYSASRTSRLSGRERGFKRRDSGEYEQVPPTVSSRHRLSRPEICAPWLPMPKLTEIESCCRTFETEGRIQPFQEWSQRCFGRQGTIDGPNLTWHIALLKPSILIYPVNVSHCMLVHVECSSSWSIEFKIKYICKMYQHAERAFQCVKNLTRMLRLLDEVIQTFLRRHVRAESCFN